MKAIEKKVLILIHLIFFFELIFFNLVESRGVASPRMDSFSREFKWVLKHGHISALGEQNNELETCNVLSLNLIQMVYDLFHVCYFLINSSSLRSSLCSLMYRHLAIVSYYIK